MVIYSSLVLRWYETMLSAKEFWGSTWWKTSFAISLPSSKLTIPLVLFTNMMLLTLRILALSGMHVICYITDLDHHRVSVAQWWSNGAQNLKVWGSIPHGYSEYFLCPMLVTRQTHLLLPNYYLWIRLKGHEVSINQCHSCRSFV